jgi:type I restriction enzyme S subunit
MPKIDQTTVENLPLPLPPADEQETISVAVEEIMSAIDSNETLIAAATKRSPRLRQSILKRAFEGRLVPQDPSDEPATVLIERIAKGRAEATTKKNKRQKKQNRKKSKAAGR